MITTINTQANNTHDYLHGNVITMDYDMYGYNYQAHMVMCTHIWRFSENYEKISLKERLRWVMPIIQMEVFESI